MVLAWNAFLALKVVPLVPNMKVVGAAQVKTDTFHEIIG